MKIGALNPIAVMVVAGMVVLPAVGAGIAVPAATTDQLFPENPPDVEVEPVTDGSQYVTVSETDGTNKLRIAIDNPGVNDNAITTFDGLIRVTHVDAVDQPITITTEATGPSANALVFHDATGTQIDNSGLELDPGESTKIGLSVDTTSSAVDIGDKLKATITVNAKFKALPEGIEGVDGGTPAPAPINELPDDIVNPESPAPPQAVASASESTVTTGETVTLSANGTSVDSLDALLAEKPANSEELITTPLAVTNKTGAPEEIRITVNETVLGTVAPEETRIVHSPDGTDNWELLTTTVTDTDSSAGTVTLQAPINSLSPFAIIDDSAIDYRWETVDGESIGTGFAVEKSFAKTGEQQANLTVSDALGQSSNSTTTVTVEDSDEQDGDGVEISDPDESEDTDVDVEVDLDEGESSEVNAEPVSSEELNTIEPNDGVDAAIDIETEINIDTDADILSRVDTAIADTDVEALVGDATVESAGEGQAAAETQIDETITEAGAESTITATEGDGESIGEVLNVESVGYNEDAGSADKTVTTTETTTTFTAQSTTFGSTKGIASSERISQVVDIAPQTSGDASGEVRIAVDRELITDSDIGADEIAMGHFTGNGWKLLETDTSIRGDRITATANTESFSPFAVFIQPDVEYKWTFPDGTVKTGQNVDYKFAQSGGYTVKLQVTDALGRTATDKQEVIADDIPFGAPTVVETTDIGEQTNARLQAVVANEIGNTTVTWEFPDGTTATGAEAVYKTTPGEYDITMTVEDETGLRSTTTTTVAIGPTSVLDQSGVDMNLLVIALLSGLTLTGSVVSYRIIDWQALLARCNRNPRITALRDPVVDPVNKEIKLGALRVVDNDRPLKWLTIQLLETDSDKKGKNGDPVFEIEMSPSAEGGNTAEGQSYIGEPEQLFVPPGVEFEPETTYTIRAIVENDLGETDEAETAPFRVITTTEAMAEESVKTGFGTSMKA